MNRALNIVSIYLTKIVTEIRGEKLNEPEVWSRIETTKHLISGYTSFSLSLSLIHDTLSRAVVVSIRTLVIIPKHPLFLRAPLPLNPTNHPVFMPLPRLPSRSLIRRHFTLITMRLAPSSLYLARQARQHRPSRSYLPHHPTVFTYYYGGRERKGWLRNGKSISPIVSRYTRAEISSTKVAQTHIIDEKSDDSRELR